MAKRSTNTSTLSIPTKPVEVSDDLFDYNYCIYGAKGVGKSTLACAFPGAVNFRFEFGRQNIQVRQVPEAKTKLLLWSDFMDYLDAFLEDDTCLFAIIDSIDCCHDRCFEHVCAEYGIEDPSEAEKNSYKVWKEISSTFASAFHKIQRSGKHFITLSHDKIRTYKNPDGSEREMTDWTLSPSPAAIVKEQCEVVLYYGYSGNDRVITVRNDNNRIFCSCGLDSRFLDPNGSPIKRFEVPNIDTTDHEEKAELALGVLQSAWDNELWDYDTGEPEPPKKPTRSRRKKRIAKKK